MPAQPFDKSSKWLLQRHGESILYLGGARDVRRCRALQAELVQPRRLPDGLLEAYLAGRSRPNYFLVEIATYPERRLLDQALEGLWLAYRHLGVLPELLTLVLHPKGRLRVHGHHAVHSPLGWSELGARWKVVELWTVPAEDLLAAGDVGVIPWVPLAHYDGPPEPVLTACRQRIEAQAVPEERDNLLAVSQILAKLRYADPSLLTLLGGRRTMIESPLIQELMAERMHKDILRILTRRFGVPPTDLAERLGKVTDEEQLEALVDVAVVCTDLEAFRKRLPARRVPRRKR